MAAARALREEVENPALGRDQRSFCNKAGETTMLELNREQRTAVADMVADVGSLAAGALVFGQVLVDRPLSLGAGLLGVTMWAICLVAVVALTKRRS